MNEGASGWLPGWVDEGCALDLPHSELSRRRKNFSAIGSSRNLRWTEQQRLPRAPVAAVLPWEAATLCPVQSSLAAPVLVLSYNSLEDRDLTFYSTEHRAVCNRYFEMKWMSKQMNEWINDTVGDLGGPLSPLVYLFYFIIAQQGEKTVPSLPRVSGSCRRMIRSLRLQVQCSAEPALTTDTAHFITGTNNVFEVCILGALHHTWLATRSLSACQTGP